MNPVTIPSFLFVVLCVFSLAFLAFAGWIVWLLWEGVKEENAWFDAYYRNPARRSQEKQND